MQLFFDYLCLKGCTCFGRFLRPSSGAHNYTFIHCIPSTIAACSIIGLTIPEVECTVMCSWWWAEKPF